MTVTSWIAPTLGLMSSGPHAHGPFSVFRKTGQGAAAGGLGLNGAGAFGSQAPAAPPAPVDMSSLEGLGGALMSGAFNSQLQIVAAALIFLAAGRCIARIFGLGLVILAFVGWQQGMRWDDVAPMLTDLIRRLGAAYSAFLNPPA